MTDKRTTPEPAGGRRRKRPAPTIDLTATEVPPADTAAAPPEPRQESSKQPPVQERAGQSQRETKPAAPDEPVAGQREAAGDSRHSPRGHFTGGAVVGGMAGAAVMALLAFAVWLTGMLPIDESGRPDARVAALEAQLQDLQKRPATAADTTALDALGKRLARMEESVAKIPADIRASVQAYAPAGAPELAERVAAADNAMKSLGVALTALNRRNDDIAAAATQARERAEAAEKAVTDLRAGLLDVSKTASAGASSADLSSLQARIAALEQSAKAAREELARTSASDKAARLALSAAILRDAVLRGAPFVDELAQVKSLGASDTALAPLAPFAATGVPSEKALMQELGVLLPEMLKASGAQTPSGNFLERLQANAGQLVRIRPLDAPPGDAPADLLARIEIAAARGDVAAALAALGRIPDAMRAPAQGWIGKAKSRQDALAAAQRFAASSASSLGKP